MNLIKTSTISSSAILAFLVLGLQPVTADDKAKSTKPVAEQIVDVQPQLAKGPYPGLRAHHAQGIVTTGTFTPTPDAAKLSTAVHFQTARTPIIVRFSNAVGVPPFAN